MDCEAKGLSESYREPRKSNTQLLVIGGGEGPPDAMWEAPVGAEGGDEGSGAEGASAAVAVAGCA